MAAMRPLPSPALWACLSILLLGSAAVSGARVGLSWVGERRQLRGETAPRLLESFSLSRLAGGGVAVPDLLSMVTISVTSHDATRMARKLRQATDDKNEMLLDAAVEGDADKVKQLIEEGADVNTTDDNGNTPLILGTARANIEIVRALLDAGANVNAQGNLEFTALRVAASLPDDQEAILELLLTEGADTEIADVDGATPLFAAVVVENLPFVRILLKNGANPSIVFPRNGNTAVMQSARLNTADIMKELLKAGATINETTPGGATALIIASAFGVAEMPNLLLDAGADTEARTFQDGFTAVLFAALFGNQATFDVLVARGADLTVTTNGGLNALHNAALAANNTPIMQTLLDEGIDVNATTDAGQTAINIAAWIGDKPNVEFLLSKDADPALNGVVVCGCVDSSSGGASCPVDNCRSREDVTVIQDLLGIHGGDEDLLQAVEDGNEEAVLGFVDEGADVNSPNRDGETPLILASSRGLEEIVTILLGAGADVNATDNIGLSPLIAASFFGHAPVVRVLIDAGADIEAGMTTSDAGVTSMHAAAMRGHPEVIELLIDAGADPNAQTTEIRYTALALAAQGNHLEVVRALVDGGADATLKTSDNLTTLHLAAGALGTEKIMNILLDEGVDVNARAVRNLTAVTYAAYFGNRGGVLFLISRGADTQIGDDDGLLREVCGCLLHQFFVNVPQCPTGACRTQEQIDEIDALMGGDEPEAAIPSPGSSPPQPLTPPSNDTATLSQDVEDCSSLPSTIAQLECLSAAGDAQPT